MTDEGGVRFDVPGNSSAVAPPDNAPIGGFKFYLFSDAGRSFHVTVDDVRITYVAEQPPTTTTSSIQASVGQNCAVDGGNAVDVDQVSRKNGQPGIGSQLYVDVKVNKPPEGGHNYWLISKITDSRAVYDAKYRIDAAIGPQRVELSLPTSGKGATRDLFVVDGDPGGSQWLQQNKDNDGDPRWDSNRLSLAGGVVKVSNACSITKTVDGP